jgi:hypothetical protein
MEPSTGFPFAVSPARRRRPVLGGLWIGLGHALVIAVVVLSYRAAFASFASIDLRSIDFRRFFGAQLPYALAWLAVGTVWRAMTVHGRKLLQWDAIEVLGRDSRAPILYLRSFDDDAALDPGGSGKTIEVRLAEAFRKLGPVISIGKPGEKLPELGTSRFYVSDDDWRTAIEYFLQRAQAIVILVGESPGVRWEVEEALRTASGRRLLFFFPHLLPRRERNWPSRWRLRRRSVAGLDRKLLDRLRIEREERYRSFRRQFGTFFTEELPTALAGSHFLLVAPDQSMRLLPNVLPLLKRDRREDQGLTLDYSRTLRPILDELLGESTAPGVMERVFTTRSTLRKLNWTSGGLALACFVSWPFVGAALGWPGIVACMLGVTVFGSLAYYGLWTQSRLQRPDLTKPNGVR